MKIRCVITDDEPYARKGLEKYVHQIDFLELVATCESAVELHKLICHTPVDLVFLDIEMPHLSGIQFLKSTPHSPAVIFTTAYEQYAIEGYQFDVLDYLLKPISFSNFLKAATKAQAIISAKAVKNHIFIKSEGKIQRVLLSEVLYLEAMQNYVVFHLSDRQYIAHLTLKNVYEQLPRDQFIHPHKSYVVALNKINTIEGNQLTVGKRQIPISKYRREKVLKQIMKGDYLQR